MKGGVEVIANEASLRETRNIVGYSHTQRFTGEAANAQAKSNFKNTISFFNRLLGLSSTYPNLMNETKWISSKIGTNQEGMIVHEVSYKGQNMKLLPEQVTGAMLGDIRKILTLNNLPNQSAVISVPSYYTEQEKKALRDACSIAGLNPIKLLHESSAISLSYGIFRKDEFDQTVHRNIAFIDFGHSKLSCFVSSFTQEKLSIVSQVHDRNLGARDIDWIIFQYYSKKFEQANGLSISGSKKSQLRLLDAIEKQRKILSANSEADCNCEYIIEDYDLNEHLTRSDFEKLIQPILQRIKQTISLLIEDLKSKRIELHGIEIVGGGVRIPAVQQIIQQAFGVSSVHKTLNQTECISRGCAIMSAMMSPQFKVAQYQVEDSNFYDIQMSWDFFHKNQKGEKIEYEGKTCLLFEKGCIIPTEKSITFNKNEGIIINVFYVNPPLGFESQLANYVISPSKPQATNFSAKISLQLDKNGLVSLEKAQLLEGQTIGSKNLAKANLQATPDNHYQDNNGEYSDQQYQNIQGSRIDNDIQKKNKTRCTDLNLEYVSKFYQQTKQNLEKLIDIQNNHAQNDEQVINTLNKKNQLESFIYKWQQQINTSHKAYCTPQENNTIVESLKQCEQWLYGQGANSTFQEYNSHLEELQKLINIVEVRQIQYTQIPEAINQLKNNIVEAEKLLISSEEKYRHLTRNDKKPLSDEIDRIRFWLNKTENKQLSQQLLNNPVITIEEIQNKINSLQNIYNKVISKPNPYSPKKVSPTKSKVEAQRKQYNNDENITNRMDIES